MNWRRDKVREFIPGNSKSIAWDYSGHKNGYKWYLSDRYDIMSVSEREQAQLVHRERRMTITGKACDIMSVSEREQAQLVHRERRMAITGKACDIIMI